MTATVAISEDELRSLWDRFITIVCPPRPLQPQPWRPLHVWTASKWWRACVYTSPGREAYPGCRVCGVTRDNHSAE